MARSQIGAVYGTKSRLLQRVFIPDTDDVEIVAMHIHSNETLLLVPIEVYRLGGLQAVQALIGEPTTSGRCAIVHKDTGEITGHCIWDTAIHGHDHPDGHFIIEMD